MQLRDDRKPEYLFRDPIGGLIYVSSSKKEDSYYDSFKFYFAGEDMVSVGEIPVEKVVRYRDGGTTLITTLFGELYVPAPFSFRMASERAIWTPRVLFGQRAKPARRLTRLDPAHFDIIEFEGGVRIHRRKTSKTSSGA